MLGCNTVDAFARPGLLWDGRSSSGQFDLVGNVAEWGLDYLGPYPKDCYDCVNRTFDKSSMSRGGTFSAPVAHLANTNRGVIDTDARYNGHGARCARRY